MQKATAKRVKIKRMYAAHVYNVYCIGIPLPLPAPWGGIIPALAPSLPLFVIVSSTDKIKLVASVALFKALIFTRAGSPIQIWQNCHQYFLTRNQHHTIFHLYCAPILVCLVFLWRRIQRFHKAVLE